MTERITVAVLGAAGRMGSQAVTAIEQAPDLQLVAALGSGDSLEQLIEAAEQFDAAAGAAKTLQFKLARAASGRTPRIDSSAEAFVAGHTAGMRVVREALGLGE